MNLALMNSRFYLSIIIITWDEASRLMSQMRMVESEEADKRSWE